MVERERYAHFPGDLWRWLRKHAKVLSGGCLLLLAKDLKGMSREMEEDKQEKEEEKNQKKKKKKKKSIKKAQGLTYA